MRKTLRIRDLLPIVQAGGYATAEAKKILINAFDSLVRSLHTQILTSINKLKFLKYSLAISNAVEQRLKRDNQRLPENNQLRSVTKQASEVQKINEYIKEKFEHILTLKSGSVIVFQYVDENDSVTNRIGFVVGGSEGPDKTWFKAKNNEIYLKVIDISKQRSESIYSLLRVMNEIETSNKGESMGFTFTDAVTDPRLSSFVTYDNFRSFNANRVSYLSTLKIQSIKT